MVLLIFVRDINANKHFFDKYVIVLIYIFDYNKNDKFVKTIIIRKIHLIDNFKINILFKTNFIELKKIDINMLKRTIYIKSCDVITSLKIRISCNIVQILVYTRKIIVVLSYFEVVFLVYYITILVNKDFFFELNELNILLYVYLTNVNFKNILICNKSS